MRAVVLSLADPFEASHGGTLRTRALIGSLTDLGHEVAVVFPVGASAPEAHTGHRTAPPAGVQVVPVPSSTLGNRAWPRWVKAAKRTLLPLPTTLGGRSAGLAAALRSAGPVDVLLVSVLPFAQYLAELPGARLWVDHSDLYSDVVGREAARRRGLAQLTAAAQHRAVLRSEDRLAGTAAITTTAGLADASALQERTGSPVTWLPTPVDALEVPRDAATRPVAGFFANFHYWPNLDAWELLRTVWAPRLAALGWDVVVAGLASDTLPDSPHLELMGPVASPADFYRRVDVTLAPVRVGGGMKVKVVESLSHGRPVVATPFAVAGFPAGLAGCVDLVDAHDPVFEILDAGPPGLPSDLQQHLGPFSHSGFRATVDEMLAGSGARSTAAPT